MIYLIDPNPVGMIIVMAICLQFMTNILKSLILKNRHPNPAKVLSFKSLRYDGNTFTRYSK